MNYVRLQSVILSVRPSFSDEERPNNRVRRWLFDIIKHVYFDLVILSAIILNIIIMGCEFDEAPIGYVNALEFINLGFTSVFIIEGAAKITALGFGRYIGNHWNQFDFVIVCFSVFDIIALSTGSGSFNKFLKSAQIIRVIRVLRVTKLFKLIKNKRLESIKKIMKTLVAAFPSFVNIFALLGIVYFIYSVLGVFLFNEAVVANKKYQNTHLNFYNFGNALLTLFKCSTGEDWHMIMYEYSTVGKVQTYVFFISFILFTTFILLNMIILIVVSTFEEYYFGKDIEEQYMDMFEDFHKLWNTFAKKTHGERIPASKLVPFFKDLTAPLGFKIRLTYDMDGKQDKTSELNENEGFFYAKPIHEIYRDIYKLNIQVDQDSCVSFGLLLFHACKRAFGNSLMLNCASEENLQLLKQSEFET